MSVQARKTTEHCSPKTDEMADSVEYGYTEGFWKYSITPKYPP